ncbi:Panacea domain-containing protein [Bacillus mesophilum]|uniref:SocA family protein n=1 Tax=Bacillus mesophilum TaxID=1071718 RepID=A0A7V7RPB9_9BACI|nr:type II toxin-antitoxin system antitoxin SocA domain-containing protein [Bacillus mesophilum]KAB2335101.1 SocA family protein [Bacillus mesophilum]
MAITVFNVADFFLNRVKTELGSSITHLKLQKLCYYAQAWYLALEDNKLFNERFEAWVHGPVCPDLFQKYRDHQWQSLRPVTEFEDSIFTQEQLDHLEEIWEIYGKYDGKFLEELTHQEDPWIDARDGYDPTERCNNIIDVNHMKIYYRDQLED